MTGPNIRVFGLAKHLGMVGVNVTLYVPGNVYLAKNGDIRPEEPLQNQGFLLNLQKIPGLTFLISFLASILYGLQNFKLFRREKFDAILVEESVSSGTLLSIVLKILFRKPIILDKHNVLYPLIKEIAPEFGRKKSILRNMFLSFAMRIIYLIELLGICTADMVLVVSKIDKIKLLDTFPTKSNKVFVIPNGVDLVKYTPNVQAGLSLKKKLGLQGKTIILYTGGLNYTPNLIAVREFIEKVMTRILQVRDDIFFVVVGHTSPDVVLKKDSNTLFTGYVKNEIPYINMADVCVAPLTIGGGTRIKILNYMACGKPVIATPVGTEGLDVQDGESVLIANIDAFYGKLLFLLTNPAKKEEMGLHARKTVESLYSWKLIADNLVTHLRSCITNSKEYD